MLKKNKSIQIHSDILAPVGEKHAYVTDIRAEPGDYVKQVGDHFAYCFGTYRFPFPQVLIKKKVFEYYKSLPKVVEKQTEEGVFYTLTKDSLYVEIKTLKQFLNVVVEKAYGTRHVSLKDVVRISEILAGNPEKKDYVIFENGGNQVFSVWDGHERVKSIINHNESKDYLYAYCFEGKEVIVKMPTFL